MQDAFARLNKYPLPPLVTRNYQTRKTFQMSSTEARLTRLLLCSSNLEKLEPLRQRLMATGAEVDCVTQAEQARGMLWENHYDGVAVDLLLADRDGISFAMELRHEHPWVSLLVISPAQQLRHDKKAPDWLTRTSEYARLIFALKQAGQRSAGRAPKILHVEDDDTLADLVKNTIGKQTRLFRARSAQEARIAMALRDYDLALIRTQTPDETSGWTQPLSASQALLLNMDENTDPVLSLLNHLRRAPYVHEAAYC